MVHLAVTKEETKCCHALPLGPLSTADGGLRVIFKLENQPRIGRPSQGRALKMEMSPRTSFEVLVEGTRGKYSDRVFHAEKEIWLQCESQISGGGGAEAEKEISGCYACLGRTEWQFGPGGGGGRREHEVKTWDTLDDECR